MYQNNRVMMNFWYFFKKGDVLEYFLIVCVRRKDGY